MLNAHKIDSWADYTHHTYVESLLDSSANEKNAVMRLAG